MGQARFDSVLSTLNSKVRFCLRIHFAHIAGCAFCNEGGAVSIFIPHSALRIKKACQGDHGGCRANCRCCIPALAGFVSPHSMGPGTENLPQAEPFFKQKSIEIRPEARLIFCEDRSSWKSLVFARFH